MTSDSSIHDQIDAAIAEERQLRSDLSEGKITLDAEHKRIAELETQLDRLWDLLRQRNAERQYGNNPDDARLRSADEVENYES